MLTTLTTLVDVLNNFYCQLFEVECTNVVHIGKCLVFAAHTPNKGVVACSNTAVDGPAWGDNCLFIVHDDVASFFLCAH